MHLGPGARRDPDVDKAELAPRRDLGPSEAGDAHRDVGSQQLARALGHLLRGLAAHGADLFEQHRIDAEQGGLHVVLVADDAPAEHVARARHVREARAKEPARAGLGAREPQAVLPERFHDAGFERHLGIRASLGG